MNRYRLACASVALFVLAAGLQAADLNEVARKTTAANSKSVVTVRVVIKVRGGGMGQSQEEEQKLEIVGTVIDPAGLTVTSASALDPTTIVKSVIARMGAGAQFQIDSEVKESTLVLEDGTEVEADMVLKDTDLDLAFIRPREAKKFDCVNLKPRAKAPELLEDMFVIGRLGKNANRATTVIKGSVAAVVKGPRTYYICDGDIDSNTGCIAYDAAGEPLGLIVAKVNNAPEGGGGGQLGMFMSQISGNAGKDAAMPILRSLEDVIEIATQAKTAKVPEKKPEAPKEEKKEGNVFKDDAAKDKDKKEEMKE